MNNPKDGARLLPEVRDLDEYRRVFHDSRIWGPALGAIAERHRLAKLPRRRVQEGTHIVALLGDRFAIKLFTPLFPRDAAVELAAMETLGGRLPVPTPALVARGELDGWEYVVMTQIHGRAVGDLWPDLAPPDRCRIAGGIGRLIAAQHALPPTDAPVLQRDWGDFVAAQSASAAQRQRESGLPEELAAGIPGCLEAVAGLDRPGEPPVLLHADLTHEHVLLEMRGGEWEISGYLDFGDAFVGPREYELPAPGLLIVRGEAGPLAALVSGAGIREEALGPGLRRRLMAYTLLHRYADLEWIRHWIPGAERARDLDALAECFWPLA